MNESLATLHDDLQDLLGQTVAGRYRIGALIGVGGMAAVFKAEHLGLGREMAFKVLHPQLSNNPEISARFDREAKSASRLDHVNCVQVTDFGSTEHGMKFMVMQLLEGGELTQLLGAPMEPLRAVDLALQILRGLEHAHRQGVIHRDVKPENVFVTKDHDGQEVLKLVDFGIAKVVDAGVDDKHKTTAGMVFGTPAYMSPEQAMGVEADARSDLYSTGVMLYQMLAGKLPLDNEDPVALVRMQVAADPEPLPSSVPPVLSATVARFLKKDRDERFQTAHEALGVLEALRVMLGGGEVQGAVTAANTSGPIYVDSSRQIVVDPSGQILVDASGQISAVDPSESIPVGPDGKWKVVRRRTLELRDRLMTEIQRRPRWQAWVGGATVGALLLMFFVWVASVEDSALEESGAVSDSGQGEERESGPTTATAGGAPKAASIDAAKLNEIDELLTNKKVDEAEALLAPLRDKFPEDAQLAWRQGRILVFRKKKEVQALAEYAKALNNDPTLLDNEQFYTQLHELMRNRRLRKDALDLALQHMGEHGHEYLLEEVNDAKKPLGYNDRQRALAELKQDKKNAPLIDWQLNRSLNVEQAKGSLTPCKSYREALEQIREAPNAAYLQPVENTPVPTAPDPEDGAAQETAADCEGLEEARIEVLALLAALEATDAEAEIQIEDEDEAPEEAASETAPANSPPPKKKKKKKKPASSSKDKKDSKKDCKGIKKANPRCWGK